MAVTHKITNKADPRNVLYGEVTKDFGEQFNAFNFLIEGSKSDNGFFSNEWEIEELPQPVVLPTKRYAVVQFYDELYKSERTLWNSGGDYWIEDDTDTLRANELTRIIEGPARAKGKFTVLYEGVD